jgi:hypothetical protein
MPEKINALRTLCQLIAVSMSMDCSYLWAPTKTPDECEPPPGFAAALPEPNNERPSYFA